MVADSPLADNGGCILQKKKKKIVGDEHVCICTAACPIRKPRLCINRGKHANDKTVPEPSQSRYTLCSECNHHQGIDREPR